MEWDFNGLEEKREEKKMKFTYSAIYFKYHGENTP